MKKLFAMLAPMVLGLMVGCSYDDSAILDKIAELEKEKEEMQEQIDAQQTLLNNLSKQLSVIAITNIEGGYIVVFSDGSSITVKDGKQGAQGPQGEKGDKGDKGDAGDSFFQSVTWDDEYVYFVLTDGSVITISLAINNSGENSEESDSSANEVYTISVDKTTIEADGQDAAAFVVTNSAGENVLENANLSKYVYFVNAEDESRLKRGSVSFSSIRNGSYEFYATVKGKKTTNTVQITAQNRRKYEKYLHKVCIFQCTSVTCDYSPYMTSALGEVRKGDNKDNVIVLACHGSIGSTNPYALVCQNGELGSIVCSRYGGEGYPYAVYDFAFGSHERSGSYINANVEEMLVRYPATCGVKISKAEIDAEGNATIEALVKADKAGTFDLAWAVLVDNQPQNGGNEEVYNDVVIAFSENFMGMSDQSKVTLAADEEYTKTYNFKIAPFRGVEFKVSDCKVVVMAHNEQMVDNANVCAVGSSVNYVYNE